MFETAITVPAALDEVWQWHARPGALYRLAPPWQPVRVLAEAASLEDGRAVLGLPGGIRWVAEHNPRDFRKHHRFVDRLVSWPLAPLLDWRHEHLFEAAETGATTVIDRVTSRVPRSMLTAMFTYRHRQLADDMAAHTWARTLRPEPLTVAMTGASGLVGTALAALLTTGGHRVIRLVRRAARGPDERPWDPVDPAPDLLDGVDAVIHLAGESIAGRFTPAHKQAVRNSRTVPTRKLATLAAESPRRPVFVAASAVGFYGPDRGDEELTEDSPRGDGFLADVVADWEAAANPAREAGLRTVQVRTGIVQTPAGGALKLQRPLFAAGLGGRLGDGQQWTAWIGLDDLLDIYLRALVDTRLEGPINAVAPHPVRAAEYAHTLGRVLRRPAILPTPEFGPRLLLGTEGAREVALAGQRAIPTRLTDIGHVFRIPELEPALRHLLGTTRKEPAAS